MANSNSTTLATQPLASKAQENSPPPACVMTFNANDPSGTGGLTADVTAIVSAGAHPLSIVTGTYIRDTGEIFAHFALDEEAVADQARAAFEDMPISAIKVGFVGSPDNLSTIAEIASDYAHVPLIAYMPDLSWWEESQIDNYLDAFCELILPQTILLIGNYSTLRRWLLPDWAAERNPLAKDIAKAAAQLGVPYTLVTGILLPDQFIENVLAMPQAVLYREKFERFEAIFAGAGETLSAALCALLANGHDLQTATAEALTYLDHSLEAGFHPGMGHVIPDRLFWAQAEDSEEPATEPAQAPDTASSPLPATPFDSSFDSSFDPHFQPPSHGTQH